MSTALLQELHQEVRRLYIAGSELAAGDFRLKRLLPQFQQLGERAPVFKRLGEGIAALVDPSAPQTQTSAETLQDLGLLLSSVLRTQGATSPEGELGAVESRPNSLSTKLSYRKLTAVQEALTTTGSGRYEVIVQAFETGMFQDLRLLQHAIAALNDPYIDIAEYAMTHILPSYGMQIVPHLIEVFNPAGGKLETRKLRVIGQVGGEEVADLVYQAADSGSDDVRATAIELLAGHEQYEEALVGWTKDKKKAIREAAYHALAAGGSERAVERLYEAFSGKDIELAAEASFKCQSSGLAARLVRDLSFELKRAPEVKEQEDKKKIEALWTRIQHFLRALDGKRSEELYELFVYVMSHYSLYSSLGWLELCDHAAYYLERADSEEALALLHELEQQHVRYMPHAFRASFRLLSPAQLYERYVESMRNKWKLQTNRDLAKRKKQLLSSIEQKVISREYRPYPILWSNPNETVPLSTVVMLPPEQIAAQWDQRWLDWFIEQNALELVCAFAQPGHAAAEQFMIGKLESNPELRNAFAGMLLSGLERAGAGDDVRWEALVTALEDKRNTNCYVFEGHVLEQLYQLPPAYCDRLEAILPKFKYTAGEQLRHVVETMQAGGSVASVAESV
ncbi:HEAT repeat domain-containing protein [Paenibacillus apiarius]|uniref:HEAT repeat domain-containing protein n=1 Tax=Paenibacillus apiarius TaxID=46240 RepID=A0ABT4DZR7_9BACL|nr:HEAT repeat domain-containing protein [Paenibacillus apiarius]MCY9517481.1 HEAT repeat domain-containing protein [Paenibacillus apiarius]MCY9522240.1 HEAT repeat domain-containing protein [Paenibacillus apiarius]MCY9552273.1 HEAT repeat domain-containing protein [Paenibacillus apiarius]MCY9560153.1 HEAT repeat domain-containing protein [Paenibacillus apiarius]MCY9683771.1 HEAT repeat domain-containing protein [Paenibacillus apiarius]